jgi:hypothetical protein
MEFYSRTNSSPRPWSLGGEIRQRAANVKNMLKLAWLASKTDSSTFAICLLNSVQGEKEMLIAATMPDGRVIDPDGVYDLIPELGRPERSTPRVGIAMKLWGFVVMAFLVVVITLGVIDWLKDLAGATR